MSVTCDVSREDQVKALMDKTVERFGKIDILVNNAALFAPLHHTKVQDIDVDLWDKVFAVNVRGSFLTAKHAVPHMIARKYGKIVNIGSGTVYKGLPGMLHYTASKGAIATFTRTLSRELGEHGICVNTLAPGLVMSETLVASGTHDEALKARVVGSRAFKRDQIPPGSARGTDFPVVAGERFRHRPDHRGRRRLGEYLIAWSPIWNYPTGE